MSEHKLYRNVEASLVRFCNRMITNNEWVSFEPFNYDTHAIINSLPSNDLLGIGELGMAEDQGTYTVTVSFVVTTSSADTNLQKLREVVDVMADTLRVGQFNFPIVDNKTAVVVGNMTVMNGVSILPVARTEGRPVQIIAVHFAVSQIDPQ